MLMNQDVLAKGATNAKAFARLQAKTRLPKQDRQKLFFSSAKLYQQRISHLHVDIKKIYNFEA